MNEVEIDKHKDVSRRNIAVGFGCLGFVVITVAVIVPLAIFLYRLAFGVN